MGRRRCRRRQRQQQYRLPHHVACGILLVLMLQRLPGSDSCCSLVSHPHRWITRSTTLSSGQHVILRRRSSVDLSRRIHSIRGGGGGFRNRSRQSAKTSLRQDIKATTSNRNNNPLAYFRTIDGAVVLAYFCNVMTMSLPVLLAPMAAADFHNTGGATAAAAAGSSSSSIASTVAQLSSTATLGGAIGKFLNGFICQAIANPRWCSPLYLVILSFCTIAFSCGQHPQQLARAYAAMEFCASMQWVALSVLLAEHYSSGQQQKLAAALTALGLSSVVGQVVAKTVGAAVLAAHWPWRTVARWGAVTAVCGAVAIASIDELSQPVRRRTMTTTKKQRFSLRSVGQTIWAVWGSPLFWILGFGHGMAFVTRGCDRILGPLYQAVVPDISSAVAGGMTLAITLGLMRGLIVGSRVMLKASSVADKKRHVARWYTNQVMAGLGLAFITWPTVLERLPTNSVVRAALVGFLSAMMASNVAYQFYQFPAMIAQALYRDHAAVTIGFLDGCGFLLSTPIFAATSAIIPKYGWSGAWAMMSGLFAIAGVLMLYNIEPALEEN